MHETEYKSNYKQYRFLQQHARLEPGTMGWAESYVHSGVKMNFRNASYFDIRVAEGSSHFVELAEVGGQMLAEGIWGIMHKSSPTIDDINDSGAYVNAMANMHEDYEKTAQDLLHDKPYAAQMHDLAKDAVSIWKDLIDTGLDQYISRTDNTSYVINEKGKHHYDEEGVLYYHPDDKYSCFPLDVDIDYEVGGGQHIARIVYQAFQIAGLAKVHISKAWEQRRLRSRYRRYLQSTQK